MKVLLRIERESSRSAHRLLVMPILIALSLVACGAPPAVIPPGGVETHHSGGTWEAGVEAIADELTHSLRASEEGRRYRVALLGFTTPSGGPCGAGDAIVPDLTTLLFSKGMEVIERANLEKVLQEQQLSGSDLVDPNAAAELGRIVGADGVVTGTISQSGNSYKVNARIASVETATIAAVAKAKIRKSEVVNQGGCE